MKTDKPKLDAVPIAEAIESAVADFRQVVRKILQEGRPGTHDLMLSIDERGRPMIKVRGPYVPASQYKPS